MEGEKKVNVIFLGDSGVGKTCLVNRIAKGQFLENVVSTVSQNFLTIERIKDGQNYKVLLWDTAGQEKFQKMNDSYIRLSDIVLVCFEPNNSDSIEKYLQNVKSIVPDSFIILVATKCDTYDDDCDNVKNLLTKKVNEAQNDKIVTSIITSSKTGQNVEELVNIILAQSTFISKKDPPPPKKLDPPDAKSGCC